MIPPTPDTADEVIESNPEAMLGAVLLCLWGAFVGAAAATALWWLL